MNRETTTAGIMGTWQKFGAAFDANAADLTALAPSRDQLGVLLTRAVEVTQRQGALRAGKQEASKEIRAILAEGERLATGLRKLITTHYGVSSEKLTEFGIQPFRGRKRKNQPAEEPETPAAPLPE